MGKATRVSFKLMSLKEKDYTPSQKKLIIRECLIKGSDKAKD
jgi:hypothetical protein